MFSCKAVLTYICKELAFPSLISVIIFCKLKLMFVWCVFVDSGILPAIDLMSGNALVGVSFRLCYSILMLSLEH